LNEEGVYRLYDLQGDYRQFSLGPEAAELGIIDARIHDGGLVAMTSSFNLLEVKDWEGARPLSLASTGAWSAYCLYSDSFSTRSDRSAPCLGYNPAGPKHFASYRSPAIRRHHNPHCRQSGKCGSTHLPRTFYTHITIAKWQILGPAYRHWYFVGCVNRLPEKHGRIRHQDCSRG